MQKNNTVSIEDLLSNSEVKKITGSINQEIIERRGYKPPICEAFTKPFTRLKENNDICLKIHSEAASQLPKMIKNKVQDIEGLTHLMNH